jgi:hypothetical protein
MNGAQPPPMARDLIRVSPETRSPESRGDLVLVKEPAESISAVNVGPVAGLSQDGARGRGSDRRRPV